MSQIPAGWYPDPSGEIRWWDGAAWTEHTQPGTQSNAVEPETNNSGYGVAAPEQSSAANIQTQQGYGHSGHTGHSYGQPQQSYGATPYTEPGGRPAGKVYLAIGAAVVALLIAVFMFTRTDPAENTAKEFVTALLSGDCAKAKSLSNNEREIDRYCPTLKRPEFSKLRAAGSKDSGSGKAVEVRFISGKQDLKATIVVEKIDGEWKVTDID